MTAPSFDRQGQCPQCGAPIVFRFAGANAQVCAHCRFVVVRADRDLTTLGKVADLVAIPSPFQVGTTGTLDRKRFRIAGRVQYDRVGAASAPWEELVVAWEDGTWSWLAQAQGRLYLTEPCEKADDVPAYDQAVPGTLVTIGNVTLRVTERGSRRMISGEGELPFAIDPRIVEKYADLSGPNGAFGTIDYGDGSARPVLYLGHEVPRSQLSLDEGVGPPPELPEVKTRALECPGCGGNLPLVSPGGAERVICPYCHMASDTSATGLVAVEKFDRRSLDPMLREHLEGKPRLALGAKAKLRGQDVTCIAFMVRSVGEGERRFLWDEYLLYVQGGGYLWLIDEGDQSDEDDEDGAYEKYDEEWMLSRLVAPGDVRSVGAFRVYQDQQYYFVREGTAKVEYVIGELYWKVEVGEKVDYKEWEHNGLFLAEERSGDEVTFSYAVPISYAEIVNAFLGDELRNELGKQNDLPSGFVRFGCLLPVLWCCLFVIALFGPDEEKVFESRLIIPRTETVYDDDHVLVGDRTCADWRESGDSVPDGCQPKEAPDRAIFTPTFEVTRAYKTIQIELEAPTLRDSWVGADIALIDDERGYVYESVIDLEYYEGEGVRKDSVSLGRIPAGRYLVRVDPAWEQGKPTPELRLSVRSGRVNFRYFEDSLWCFVFMTVVGVVGSNLFSNTRARRFVIGLTGVAMYGVVGFLGAHVFLGYDVAARDVAARASNQIPESVRTSPGGYRSWAFWHAGTHGGKWPFPLPGPW